ncbi:MAG: malto-oligosyltrehalose trehalohydrolase [Elainellaceae cyanobacterium]
MQIGATYKGDGYCDFTVWAPVRQNVTLELLTHPSRKIPFMPDEWGYWRATVSDIKPGDLYRYWLDDDIACPDPASYAQPENVSGPSKIVDHAAFDWQDGAWNNIPLEDYIAYEIHVGTFTPEGTFAAIIPRLAELKDLGINALELMPVAQFPGDRNWGYDGVYPYAVQHSYGGVEGLKTLVDACHQAGIAVILDVVYNHFGPEGNYTHEFGHYFTERYRTPWGSAINYDDAYSPAVRNFTLENVLYWLREFHIDALRLDAVHAIYDCSARHLLGDMTDRVTDLARQENRPFYLIAESDLNDPRVIRPRNQGGHGIHAQWCDDFHHSLHTLLTGESADYYQDFGRCEQFANTWTQGFAYTGQYSQFRQRYHGDDISDRPPSQFVAFAQNHDHVGNRMLGDRLSKLISFDALKLSAGAVITAPALPLLFMGEEYGDDAPFFYFISHSDEELIQAVRDGRKREFADLHALGEPPDAASLDTFQKSILRWEQRTQDQHGVLLKFYQRLIQLRRSLPPLKHFDRQCIAVDFSERDRTFSIRRWKHQEAVLILMNFSPKPMISLEIPPEVWTKQLDSSASEWNGAGDTLPDQIMGGHFVQLPASSIAIYTQDHFMESMP